MSHDSAWPAEAERETFGLPFGERSAAANPFVDAPRAPSAADLSLIHI